MKLKRIYIKLISMLLIIAIIVGTIYPLNINAAGDSDTSEYTVLNSDGIPALHVIMKDGKIKIEMWDYKATSNIRFETKGFNILREKINKTHALTIKGHEYHGPDDVTNYKRTFIPYEKKPFIDRKHNPVYTKMEYDADYIENKLKTTFDDIKKDEIIYINFTFDTYYTKDDGITKDTRKGNSYYGIQNWEEIMKAEGWSKKATLDNFSTYFNIPIAFKPRKQPNTLHYMLEEKKGSDPKEIASEELESKYPGQDVEWSGKKKSYNVDNKTYNLYKSYVKCTGHKAPNAYDIHKLGDLHYETAAKLANDSTTEYIPGVDVYLVYQPKAAPPITVTPTPTGTITPSPTKKPTATPTPSVTPIITIPPEKFQADMEMPDAYGKIGADDRGTEKFTATQGVPTTESLYTNVVSNDYLMGYDLEKKTGIETYSVRVTKDYNLSWSVKGAKGKITPMSSTVPVTQYVSIKRAYGYWEINNFDYYKINKAVINNYSLPNGKTIMFPNSSSGYSPPNVSINHSTDKNYHILVPDDIKNGIELPSESLSGGFSVPSIPSEDFTADADARLPEVNIKNDLLQISGTKIMSDDIEAKEGPHVLNDQLSQIREDGATKCNENVLYKPHEIIEATKKNGTYNSSGVITYARGENVNSKYTDTVEAGIQDINCVVIHTPVLCDPIVTEDNDRFVQLIHPSSAKQVVLDPDSKLNDFTLKISNYGPHSYKMGYYTRDFSRSLIDPENVSYIAEKDGKLRNEVKFPFDVYLKGEKEDKFIKKDTWVIIGRATETFYVPMWVQEGIYTVKCRSIAVNADMDQLDKISESYVNSQLVNYVATNTFDIEVSGRIYGLSIYDLTDYPMWKEAFRVKHSLKLKINDRNKYPDGTVRTGYNKNYSYDYTVGTNDQYGNDTRRNIKYTFPLVNGSHPFYKNIGVLKTGYAVRFKLNTTGTMYGSGCKVRIKPTFYYVDAKGENRTRVDIYYSEEINGDQQTMVKMGSKLDYLNQKTMEAGSPYAGIPRQEMKNTASISNIRYRSFICRLDALFSFTNIRILSSFRTFINSLYTKRIESSKDYDKVKDTGITQENIMKQMQSWYGYYYLPGIMHAVDPNDVPNGWTVYQYAARKGVTYHESWWKKDGYIIVNFDIVTVDSDGNERLSYINADNYLNNNNCSMWTMEGAPISKMDNKGVAFHFKAGDFIIYYAGKSIHDDYRSDRLK